MNQSIVFFVLKISCTIILKRYEKLSARKRKWLNCPGFSLDLTNWYQGKLRRQFLGTFSWWVIKLNCSLHCMMCDAGHTFLMSPFLYVPKNVSLSYFDMEVIWRFIICWHPCLLGVTAGKIGRYILLVMLSLTKLNAFLPVRLSQ